MEISSKPPGSKKMGTPPADPKDSPSSKDVINTSVMLPKAGHDPSPGKPAKTRIIEGAKH